MANVPEVARVDPDRSGASSATRARELLGVVRLDERVEAELARASAKNSRARRSSRSRGGGGRRRRRASAISGSAPGRRRIPWRAAGLASRPRRAQVVNGAAEALVDEDGDRGGAGSPERAREERRDRHRAAGRPRRASGASPRRWLRGRAVQARPETAHQATASSAREGDERLEPLAGRARNRRPRARARSRRPDPQRDPRRERPGRIQEHRLALGSGRTGQDLVDRRRVLGG